MDMVLFGVLENMNPLLVVGVAGLLAFLGGKLLFRSDERIEDMKRTAVGLSGKCERAGLPLTAGLLEALAVGDISGAIASVKEIARVLGDEVRLKETMNTFLTKQLKERLDSTDEATKLYRFIEDYMGVKIVDPKIEVTHVETKQAA